MSRTKRTPAPSPGPWKFISRPRRLNQWCVKAADGFSVVGFAGPDSGFPGADAQDFVNGHLIASTPELLAELKRIHKIVESEGGIACFAGILDHRAIAKVIRKAEGRP
jgi:hypothetical protein